MIDFSGMGSDSLRIIDSMPVPLLPLWRVRGGKHKHWKREVSGGQDGHVGYPSEIGEADIGYCAAKEQYYFGMTLQVSATTTALPTHWLLTPVS